MNNDANNLFIVDARLSKDAWFIYESDLCLVYLKDSIDIPWFILIPKREQIREIYQLNHADQLSLLSDINLFSRLMEEQFHPHKLNVANLGNIVPQLHIHIVGRYEQDLAWPFSIWQNLPPFKQYPSGQIQKLIEILKIKINKIK